jgi:hypothetical protein
MTRVCKIILVCEGWRDSAFARGFLGAAGVDGRVVDPKVNPGGCGHGWVKAKFVEEVANLTRFSEGRGVLGLIDEDGQGVAAREREIADLLQERNLPGISASSGRCLLLPTRNLETWLYWLIANRSGITTAINETTNYKTDGPPAGCARLRDDQCRSAGEHLHTLNHATMPGGSPPVLGQSLERLRDFLNAVRR